MNFTRGIREKLLSSKHRDGRKKEPKNVKEVVDILERDEYGKLKTYFEKGKVDVDHKVDSQRHRHGGPLSLYHISATSKHANMVTLFLENGAEVNELTAQGETALHLTAWNKHSNADIVDRLVDKGIRINARDVDRGYTALHEACERRNHGIVRRLLDHFADDTVLDNNGRTALDIARSVKCDQTVALLQNRNVTKVDAEVTKRVEILEQQITEQNGLLQSVQQELRLSRQSLNIQPVLPSSAFAPQQSPLHRSHIWYSTSNLTDLNRHTVSVSNPATNLQDYNPIFGQQALPADNFSGHGAGYGNNHAVPLSLAQTAQFGTQYNHHADNNIFAPVAQPLQSQSAQTSAYQNQPSLTHNQSASLPPMFPLQTRARSMSCTTFNDGQAKSRYTSTTTIASDFLDDNCAPRASESSQVDETAPGTCTSQGTDTADRPLGIGPSAYKKAEGVIK